MHRILRLAAACGVVALLVALLPIRTEAHERRDLVGGRYEIEVGFVDEPAYVGEKNGIFFHVSEPGAATPVAEGGEEGEGAPVLGLADTLQAEVIYDEETMELELRPGFAEPGTYHGYFFPTAEGDYSFRIFGDMAGNPIDERFTSSPEGFDGVQPREPLESPKSESGSGQGGIVAASIGGVGSGGTTQLAILTLGVLATGGFHLGQRRMRTRRSAGVAEGSSATLVS